MPLYEYRCDAYGHRFELIQKFSDEPVSTCPECGGVVSKLVSSPAFQLKGTGWYVTDFAGKPKPGASKETSAEGSDSGKKGSSSDKKTGDSKPTKGGSSEPSSSSPSSATTK